MLVATRRHAKRPKRLSRSSPVATLAQVRSLINVAQELKFFDSHVYGSTATSTPAQFGLSAIPQGATDSTRDGDQVNLRSVEIRADCYLQATGGTNDFTDIVRMVIYRWHPMSTTTKPVPADVLLDLSNAESAVTTLFSWDNRRDFTILMDKRVVLSGNGPSIAKIDFKHTWKPPGLPSHFSNGSTTLQTQGLFLLVMSDSQVATHPLYNYYARVTYADS
jgi:hypothetical protein